MAAPGRVPVLMYHELLAAGGSPARPGAGYARYVIAGDTFHSHLETMKTAGTPGVAIGTALEPGSDPCVALTFDDGCASDLLVAAPLLVEFGFTATFYITVDWIGTTGFLMPAQVRELAAHGFQIASHSLSHPYLTDLAPDRLRLELTASRDRLEQISGVPVRHFSCPGGRWSRAVADVAREAGYESVADSRPVAWVRGADRFRIGRFAVTADTSVQAIARLCRKGTWESFRLRSLVLGAAKTLLGNRLYDRARRRILEDGSDA
jgi:peptidoglycan/xylan/chitin deacetylase (PgdA/CDA1 family)